MPKRQLYLVAYDVSDARRLRCMLGAVKAHATGGQKSVFECYLSEVERTGLLREVGDILDLEEDRFFLIRLDPRSRVRTLGRAVPVADPDFFYVG
ncbi:CRISPR-associated endonuclease Cas2 [Thiohalobacter sp. IOR34]|uniref:CRISPR-associated endonuclease Cas2 n=1 Tax=Thiohalobacter sp. IOR34 TaxID=3057176 RepID=UPI0025B01BAE|nr:CRISPR-associated endonuclease Cas2 [Thiohalobacter sp. IOR34]WJW76675.1 CRISPR-associated endonuclease Cas2 [Thiohalobacter sp. IOR34]